MKSEKQLTWKVIGILATLALIWGSSFILVKKSLQGYEAMQVGGLRIFAASLLFIPIFLKRRKHIQSHHWRPMLLAGLSGNFLPALLFSFAGSKLPSALSGMLNSFTPLFTLLLGYLFYKQRYDWKQSLGIGMGLLGCLGLMSLGKNLSLDFNVHALWVVLATLLYGFNVHIVKNKLSDLHPLSTSSGVFMIIGPMALATMWFSGFFDLGMDDAHFWPLMAGIALGLGGSGVAMILFNQLIKLTNPILASSVTYLIPIVALFWGIADGEQIYFGQLASMGILLAGVYLVSRPKAQG